MRLKKEEKKKIEKALKASIKHWEKDILTPLKSGSAKLNCTQFHLKDGRTCRIPMWGDDCPLCKMVSIFPKKHGCNACPISVYHRIGCNTPGSVWRNFKFSEGYSEPLQKAKDMVKHMQVILDDIKGLYKKYKDIRRY